MKSNRVFIALGSVNTIVCLRNAIGVNLAFLSVKTKGYNNGSITDLLLFQRFIQEILIDLEIQINSTITDVVLGMYGGFCHTDIIDIPLKFSAPKIIDNSIENKLMNIAKQWCADRKYYLIHMNKIGMQVDGNDVESMIGLKCTNIQVIMNVCFGEMIPMDNVLEAFKNSYVNIIDIIPVPLLLGECILSQDLKELGMILLDFGGATTTISGFYQGKMLFIEQIPIGGEMLTRKIAQVLNINIDEAERLKCIYGSAVQMPQDAYEWLEVALLSGKMLCINKVKIVELTSLYTEELLKQISKKLQQMAIPDYLRKRILLAGQGSKMNKLHQAVESILQCDVNLIMSEIDMHDKDIKWLPVYGLMSLYKTSSKSNGLIQRILTWLGW